MTKRRIAELASLLFVLALVVYACYVAFAMYSEGKITTTVVRMRQLMGVLQSDQPSDVSPLALAALLEKDGRQECARDAWGRSFEVSVQRSAHGQEARYTVRSLGSDGVRGPCCRLLVKSPKDDVVLQGETWLQIWAPRSKR